MPSTPMSGADSSPLRTPENTNTKTAMTVNVASNTWIRLKADLDALTGCQPSRQRRVTSQAAVNENTHHDCVDRPRPSSSQSMNLSGEYFHRPSTQASPMKTTTSPQ